jgi:hypothetical protein
LPAPASHAAAISPTARRGSSESSRAAASTRSVRSELANGAESGRAAARSGHVLAHRADCHQDRLLGSRLRKDAPPPAPARPCCAPPPWGRAPADPATARTRPYRAPPPPWGHAPAKCRRCGDAPLAAPDWSRTALKA